MAKNGSLMGVTNHLLTGMILQVAQGAVINLPLGITTGAHGRCGGNGIPEKAMPINSWINDTGPFPQAVHGCFFGWGAGMARNDC